MHRITPPWAIALVTGALALAGCAEATTKDEPDAPDAAATESAEAEIEEAKSEATEEPTETATPKPKPKPKPKKAGIGDSITLTSSDGGKVKVKLLRVLDPVSGSEFEEPAAGKRYMGVEIQLTNLGPGAYEDSPGNGATVIYGDDRAS